MINEHKQYNFLLEYCSPDKDDDELPHFMTELKLIFEKWNQKSGKSGKELEGIKIGIYRCTNRRRRIWVCKRRMHLP